MRKIPAVLLLFLIAVFSFAGCSKADKEIYPDSPVTYEQVNSEGEYVARAYLESLFTDNRAIFEKCYPEGFLDKLERASDADLYEQYRRVLNISLDFSGTASAGYKDYSIPSGFDEAAMRSNICLITGLDYSSVGQIRIQKVKAFFTDGKNTVDSDFYYLVYESNGSWYILESYSSDAEF